MINFTPNPLKVDAPKHYGDTKLMDLLIEKTVPFAEGNIMKYVYRWAEKDGLKDLYKARTYLNALIANAERERATESIQSALAVAGSAGVCRAAEQKHNENCQGVQN